MTRKNSHDVSIAVSPDREEKCDITKVQICGIMGLDEKSPLSENQPFSALKLAGR